MRLAYILTMPLLMFFVLMFLLPDLTRRVLPRPLAQLFPESEAVRIPGGRFRMGSSAEELQVARDFAAELDRALPKDQPFYVPNYQRNDYLDRESVVRSIELPSFEIDRKEVTNAAFAAFLGHQLHAGRILVKDECPGALHPTARTKDFSCVYLKNTLSPYKNLFNSPHYGGITFNKEANSFVVSAEYQLRPVVMISWQAAADFCAHQGKRLPTEAEWEYVARRGDRRFPWGSKLPSCGDSVLERCGEDGTRCSCQSTDRSPKLPDVGSTPLDRTLDGVLDMGGSVSEWTSDWFVTRLPTSPQVLRSPTQVPPADAAMPRYRVLKGGAWNQDFLSARGAARYRAQEDRLLSEVGFRCVRQTK